ncbi:hypothetical protein BB559_005024, partial [Furculomyces boomerangus]
MKHTKPGRFMFDIFSEIKKRDRENKGLGILGSENEKSIQDDGGECSYKVHKPNYERYGSPSKQVFKSHYTPVEINGVTECAYVSNSRNSLNSNKSSTLSVDSFKNSTRVESGRVQINNTVIFDAEHHGNEQKIPKISGNHNNGVECVNVSQNMMGASSTRYRQLGNPIHNTDSGNTVYTFSINSDDSSIISTNTFHNHNQLHSNTSLGFIYKKFKQNWAIFIITLIQTIYFLRTIHTNIAYPPNSSLSTTSLGIQSLYSFSQEALISKGAYFAPCMRVSPFLIDLPQSCPAYTLRNHNSVINPYSHGICTLGNYCDSSRPDEYIRWHAVLDDRKQGKISKKYDPRGMFQTFRFISAIFMPTGIIGFLLVLIYNFTIGKTLERRITSIKFMLLYMYSGISGLVFASIFIPTINIYAGPLASMSGCYVVFLIEVFKSRHGKNRHLANPKFSQDFGIHNDQNFSPIKFQQNMDFGCLYTD